MPYRLTQVTIHVDTPGEENEQTRELWRDIVSGKLPLLFDSSGTFRPGLSPVTRYSRYAPGGGSDLSVLGVTADFFRELEAEVSRGTRKKYEARGASLEDCAGKAWEQVRRQELKGGLRRAWTADYESTVPPEYTKDGLPCCYLYIAVAPEP